MSIDKPKAEEYPAYFGNYISKARWNDLFEAHEESLRELQEVLQNLPEEKWNYRYAPEKWSIKDIIGHLIDIERIMGYRAVAIARKEAQSLPGFEEADYAKNSNASQRESKDLMDELEKVRASTIALFKSLNEKAFMNMGTANNHPVSVRAIAWMIPGHVMHHVSVIREKYL